MTSVDKHYHKLKRGTYRTGTPFFKCVECAFVATIQNVVGRPVRCWKCDNPFIFTRNDSRWAKPVCSECRSTPSASTIKKGLDDFFSDIVKEDKK